MVIVLKKIIEKLNKKQKNKAHLMHLDQQHDVSTYLKITIFRTEN